MHHFANVHLIMAGFLVFYAACSDAPDSVDPPAQAPVGPITASVNHYDYAIDLATGKASVTVQASVTASGDCWTLPFRGTELTDVAFNEGAASVSVSAGLATMCGVGVNAGSPLAIRATLTVPAKTLADSQVGFSRRNDSTGKPFTYLVSWVGGCDQFGPCDNRPDQFATYRFVVTHPADTQVRCPGVVAQDMPTQTTCRFDYAGGPSYSTFGIVASPSWTLTDRGKWGPLDVTVYDRPSTGINAKIDSEYQAGFVNWMISHLGAFPFGNELRILTGPTYWSGFEHPGNIVLSDKLAQQSSRYANPVAHVLTHEIAHQWAGDQTTLKDTYDFVWKESMAEYLSFVYEDQKTPADAAKTAVAWKAFGARAAFYPVPGEKPKLFDYYGDVYGPGPMILFRQLEVLTSREQILAALKMVLGKPRALSVDEVIAALQATTGLDLSAYVAAWVKGVGAPVWPRFVATYMPGTAVTEPGTLRIVQNNVAAAGGKTCKFHVALKGTNATDVTKVAVNTFRDGPTQSISVPGVGYAVTATEIDVDSECMAFAAAPGAFSMQVPSWSEPADAGERGPLPPPRSHPWITE